MTVVLDRTKELPANDPKTHALVIGVGRYGWLDGGGKKPAFQFADGTQMDGILPGPPASARAMASWLMTTYNNPGAKLATVDLLFSDASTQSFEHDGKSTKIEPALFDKAKRAIRDWAQRSTSTDDILLFFFSGHGMASGLHTTLLCEDFGSYQKDPMEHAIDFDLLYLALDQFTSRRQVFFIDACRQANSLTIDIFGGDYGDSIFKVSSAFSAQGRKGPVFNSALAGQAAYSPKNGCTYFTQALLRTMDGSGSDYRNGAEWWVRSDLLPSALSLVMPRVVEPGSIVPDVPASHTSDFPLHLVKDRPVGIPIDLRCEPSETTAAAVLSHQGGPTPAQTRAEASANPWQLDLGEGNYVFSAAFAAPPAWTQTTYVGPPGRTITLKAPGLP